MAAKASLEVIGQVVSLAIADIDIGERLRPIDTVWAGALGQMIKVDGQDDPIKVCRVPGSNRWRLGPGGHRLVGMKMAGFSHIKAIVIDGDAIGRLMAEVRENLMRKGLEPLDRATFVAELVRLKKLQAGVDPDRDGRSVSAKARWQEQIDDEAADASVTLTHAYGWAEGVGDEIGLSRKTIYRDLELHRRLLPDVVEQLRGHPASKNASQLRALATCSEADQRSAVAMMMEGSAASPSEALAMINQKPVPDAEQKAWSAFLGGWTRMSAAKKVLALRELTEQGLPKGVTISFDGKAA